MFKTSGKLLEDLSNSIDKFKSFNKKNFFNEIKDIDFNEFVKKTGGKINLSKFNSEEISSKLSSTDFGNVISKMKFSGEDLSKFNFHYGDTTKAKSFYHSLIRWLANKSTRSDYILKKSIKNNLNFGFKSMRDKYISSGKKKLTPEEFMEFLKQSTKEGSKYSNKGWKKIYNPMSWVTSVGLTGLSKTSNLIGNIVSLGKENKDISHNLGDVEKSDGFIKRGWNFGKQKTKNTFRKIGSGLNFLGKPIFGTLSTSLGALGLYGGVGEIKEDMDRGNLGLASSRTVKTLVDARQTIGTIGSAIKYGSKFIPKAALLKATKVASRYIAKKLILVGAGGGVFGSVLAL